MLGIDAERNARLGERVWEEVAHGRERELQDAGGGGGDHLDAVLFSAKEAIFKACYPLARRWLGFGDAELSIDSSGGFAARLLVQGPEVSGAPLRDLAGRWAADGEVVVTAVLVPAQVETRNA
jgi:4'-phosphopantetheinyl transferase EntD